MMTKQQSDAAGMSEVEKQDIAQLEEFVNDAVSRMAASTNVRREDALEILENIHVEMVGELRHAVETLGNSNRVVKRIDSNKLIHEIEKTIAAISNATDLDTDEITTIFSKEPGASLADVSYRLHVRSQYDRSRFA